MADTEDNINVGGTERKVSVAAGGALALYGLSRRSWGGALLAAVGGGLLYRGATGHCAAYQALGRDTAGDGEQAQPPASEKPGAHGIQVREVVTINKSPEELYAFWRDFTNLPKFMNHLESVSVQDDNRSHWVAKAPLGRTVSWDATIINEEPNRVIAWQSVPGTGIASAGSVRFEAAAGGRGTEVRINLDYNPPAGVVGATVAKLFGEEPQVQVAEDLRRFKNLMETGETPTIEGQSVGARSIKGVVLDKVQSKHAA